MQMADRASSALYFVLFLSACGASNAPPPAESPSVAPAAQPAPLPAAAPGPASAATAAPAVEKAPPPMVLAETPTDKLGSVPANFGLKVGTKAPDATLPDIAGKNVRLGALYGEAPTFVVFYRGGWCPFCNLQLHSLTTAKPDFDKKGLRLVAISVDKPDSGAKTQAKHGVPFPMLSDSNLAVHKAFNVIHVAGNAETKALTGYGIDLASYSGQSHHSFAVPSIFLVDRSGVIRWVHIDEDYETRPSPAQLLAVAERTLKK